MRTKDGYADPNDVGRLNVLDLQVCVLDLQDKDQSSGFQVVHLPSFLHIQVQIRRLPKPVIAMVSIFIQLLVSSLHLCNDLGLLGL